ncbi:hypothetical protein TNCV_1083041 [Trichonephila clavipes]|nr:hypothetical protein TNCV_1083041 [Trichonephila clavipes]
MLVTDLLLLPYDSEIVIENVRVSFVLKLVKAEIYITICPSKHNTPCTTFYKLKFSGATVHESQGLLCPSQYTRKLGAEVHEQMSRSGGKSEARDPHLSTHCSRNERLSRPCPARKWNTDLWGGSAIRYHSTTGSCYFLYQCVNIVWMKKLTA